MEAVLPADDGRSGASSARAFHGLSAAAALDLRPCCSLSIPRPWPDASDADAWLDGGRAPGSPALWEPSRLE